MKTTLESAVTACGARFRVGATLGQGPFGGVYEGFDLSSGRPCLVKRLARVLGKDGLPWKLWSLLQRDAALSGQVSTAGILAPFAAGVDERGCGYLAYEYVEAESLGARLRRGPLSVAETESLVAALALRLGAAAEVGLRHGDLKPANVLCGDDGAVWLTDFGFGRLLSARLPAAEGYGYQPPELFRERPREPTTARDVFALGAVLYECLRGRPLYPVASFGEASQRIGREPLPPLDDVPPRVQAVIAQACDPDPQERFAEPAALARALHAALNGAASPDTERASTALWSSLPHDLLLPSDSRPPALTGTATRVYPVTAGRPSAAEAITAPVALPPPARPSPSTRSAVPAQPSRGRLALFALSGAALCLGVGAAAYLARSQPGPPRSRPPLVASPAPPRPSQRQEAQAELLREAAELLAKREYAAVMGRTELVLRDDPSQLQALDLRRRAAAGMQELVQCERLLRPARRGELDSVALLLLQQPTDLPCRPEVLAAVAPQVAPYEQAHRRALRLLSREQRCAEIEAEVRHLRVFSGRSAEVISEEARRREADCRQRARGETAMGTDDAE